MARDEGRSRGKKKDKMAVTIVTPPFRMAFPSLLEPEETDHGERYKVTALFPPSADISKIEDAMYDCMVDAFGPEEDWPSGRNDVGPYDKIYDAGKKEYAGFKKGWLALPMSTTEPPGVVDADGEEVFSKREVYGGRWARAQIVVTTYDNKSKGVTAYLGHVQLLEHDEAFSGRGSAKAAFDKYEMKDRSRDRDEADDGRSRSRDDDRGRQARGRDDDSRGRHDRDDGDRGRSSRDEGERSERRPGREERGQDARAGRGGERRDDRDQRSDRGDRTQERDTGRRDVGTGRREAERGGSRDDDARDNRSRKESSSGDRGGRDGASRKESSERSRDRDRDRPSRGRAVVDDEWN